MLEWTVIKALLSRAWSLATSPVGRWVLAAAAVAFSLWLAHHRGYEAGLQACEASHAKAATHEVVRQKAVGEVARKDSDERTAPAKVADAGNKSKVRTLYVHDQALPDADAVCVAADDADVLRSLN